MMQSILVRNRALLFNFKVQYYGAHLIGITTNEWWRFYEADKF